MDEDAGGKLIFEAVKRIFEEAQRHPSEETSPTVPLSEAHEWSGPLPGFIGLLQSFLALTATCSYLLGLGDLIIRALLFLKTDRFDRLPVSHFTGALRTQWLGLNSLVNDAASLDFTVYLILVVPIVLLVLSNKLDRYSSERR